MNAKLKSIIADYDLDQWLKRYGRHNKAITRLMINKNIASHDTELKAGVTINSIELHWSREIEKEYEKIGIILTYRGAPVYELTIKLI